MGNQISKAASIISYPFRAAFNTTFGTNPNADVNITNSDISEFNSQFADFETKINTLISKLFQNVNSSIRTFNANILFPHTQLLADNLVNHGNADIIGEFHLQREKYMLILDRIMLLYTTPQINYVPNTSNDFRTYFLASFATINRNLQRISTTYNNIQPFLNQNDAVDIHQFRTAINAHFNAQFVRQNAIIQYLRLLLEMTNRFVQRLNTEISFFRQENQTILQGTYNYTLGFFSWLARSGYTYRGTANFYTYFRDNNIIVLRDQINNKLQQITNANQRLATIRRNIESLDSHILRNVTDVFSIRFHVGNNQHYDYETELGNYTIQNYGNLCELLTTRINNKLRQDHPNDNIQFNIRYYQDQDPRLQNHVVILSNREFTLKRNSSIMRILGWNSFDDIRSNDQLDENQQRIGKFIMAPRPILNAEIGNIINYASRINTITTSINTFNTNMDIQHTAEAN